MFTNKANGPLNGVGGKGQNAVDITFVRKTAVQEEKEEWRLRAIYRKHFVHEYTACEVMALLRWDWIQNIGLKIRKGGFQCKFCN